MDRLTYQQQVYATITAAAFTDRCTIQRPTSTKGSTGGNIPGAPDILATSVPCRYKPSTANERQVSGAPQGSVAYTVRMPEWQGSSLIEIDSRCELIIAAREGGVEAMALKVIAPLHSGSGKIDVVAVKQT